MALLRPGAVALNTVGARRRADRTTWLLGYGVIVALTLVVGFLGYRYAPQPFPLAVLLLVLLCGVMLVRPVTGICMVGMFTMAGDITTATWYPFTKNLSSRESILYVSDQLSLSPLELCLMVLALGWVLGMAGNGRMRFRRGTLLWPVLAFSGFVAVGLLYGLSKGGDSKIALAESRSMFYMPLLYLLVTNLFTRREQFVRLYAWLMVGVVMHAVFTFFFFRTLPEVAFQTPEGLMQHSSALVLNTLVLLLVALRLMHGGTRSAKWLLAVSLVPAAMVYLDTKRRAAIVGLVASGLLLFVILFWTNRRKFLWLAPTVLLLGSAYTAAFWNSTGGAGFPAQAVKSVIAPNKLSERDLASNYYRYAETFDVQYTIRQSPLTGLGFGHPFLTPIALPAISEFELARYVPHNSMLYMWIKLGVAGFVSMLFLFGKAMRTGARAVMTERNGTHAAMALTSVGFVLMYAAYCYVDIAWDQKSMVFLALALGHLDWLATTQRNEAEREAVAAQAAADAADRPLASAGV